MAVGEGGSVSVNADSRFGFLVCHHPAWTAKNSAEMAGDGDCGARHADREWEDVSAFIKPC